jgi:hypothetical protein
MRDDRLRQPRQAHPSKALPVYQDLFQPYPHYTPEQSLGEAHASQIQQFKV